MDHKSLYQYVCAAYLYVCAYDVLSVWCLVMYCRLYPVEVARVRIVGWDRSPAVQ
jgi:hypothetical protein